MDTGTLVDGSGRNADGWKASQGEPENFRMTATQATKKKEIGVSKNMRFASQKRNGGYRAKFRKDR